MSASAPILKQAICRLGRIPARTAARSLRANVFNVQYRLPSIATRRSASFQQPLSSQCLRLRQFSTSSYRARPSGGDKTYQRTGPFSFRSASLFVATGLAMVFYFQYEKKRLERRRIVEMSKGYGKPKVGGPFVLKDTDGKEWTENDLVGKYTLIYFGFTNCPDICPDELDKMGAALDILQKQIPNTVRPIFVSVDPNRDTPIVLRQYLSEFHPSLIGLTGTWEQVKNMCKQYRVYFSTPPELKPGEEDYLVDHSIYFYVMDPEGDFVECIGRQDTPESAAGIVIQHIKDWRREGKKIDTTPLTHLNQPKERIPIVSGATAAIPA